MNEMVQRFLRQKFSSAGIVVALSAVALVAAPQLAATGGRTGFELATLPLLILAAGCVSRDAGSGALQMILCRPLSRGDYLLGRYLGILAAFAGFLAAAGALAVLFGRVVLPMLGGTAASVDVPSLATGALATLLGGTATAAMVVFFSTFLPGYGDVLGFILLAPLTALPEAAGQVLHAPWLQKAGPLLRRNVLPSLDWGAVLRGENVFGEATGRWVLALVVALAAALVVFSRREFAYGQD
ncbi:MAG: hypothetical protein ACM3NW_09350 [Syntrophomonadaceae bacterium]